MNSRSWNCTIPTRDTHTTNGEQIQDINTEYLDSTVDIPEEEKPGFSFRKLWAFSGPGYIMSIAFLDPGNIEADLQSGAQVGYQLIWVLFSATLLGLLMQRLAARIGVVIGKHMAEVCYTEYRIVWRVLIWIMMEIAIIGSDMQEAIGTAIAFHLLSQGKIPLVEGILITVLETFIFIFLDKYGLRKSELFFAFLIAVMAGTFGFEFFNYGDHFVHKISCEDCSKKTLMQSVSIIGSCIMPHNLYLHSGLVKSRKIDRSKRHKISEANFYFFLESGIALFISFIINMFVIAVFTKGLNGKTNADIYNLCKNSSNSFFKKFFKNDSSPVDIDIKSGGIFLGCRNGPAIYIWAIGLLAAGQSSTMSGCYAGQFTMEGFLNLTWARWKRVLLTRTMTLVALLPLLTIAKLNSLFHVAFINDFLNTLMSIQLPFAVLPAIAFSSNKHLMKEFANGTFNKILSLSIFTIITIINGMLVVRYIEDGFLAYNLIIYFYAAIYIILCIFLILHTSASLTEPDSFLNRSKLMKKYILGKSMVNYTNSSQVNVVENNTVSTRL